MDDCVSDCDIRNNHHFLRARSHCDGNGIIIIILVSSVVDVINRYHGIKWRCSHDNCILKAKKLPLPSQCEQNSKW